MKASTARERIIVLSNVPLIAIVVTPIVVTIAFGCYMQLNKRANFENGPRTWEVYAKCVGAFTTIFAFSFAVIKYIDQYHLMAVDAARQEQQQLTLSRADSQPHRTRPDLC